MSDVTRVLAQIESGDQQAASQLLPLVYDELRKLAAAKIAQEKPGQTLQATALVHEAYLRLVGQPGDREQGSGDREAATASNLSPVSCPLSPEFHSRGHFFAAAAEAMRRILIDRARRKQSLRRGGNLGRADLAQIQPAMPQDDVDLLELDEALEILAARDAQAAALVKLRCFAGLTGAEAAAALGIPERTADRVWTYARSFLFKQLNPDAEQDASR
jgi:DNA-directed RNA polymerase specialized sigma24 family protein